MNCTQPIDGQKNWTSLGVKLLTTLELRLSGLIGTASHPDTQKIRIIGFFFENRVQWQFEFLLLLFTTCTCV